MNYSLRTIIFTLILLATLSQQYSSVIICTTTCINSTNKVSGKIKFISENQEVNMLSFEVDIEKQSDNFPLENLFGLKISDEYYLPVSEGRFLKSNNPDKLLSEFNSQMGTPFEFIAKNTKTEDSIKIRCFAGLKENMEKNMSFI